MKALQHRLDLIIDRVESPKFLKNDGLGNEIGFWVFDYPAKHELLVREHLELMTKPPYQQHHLRKLDFII